MAFESPCSNTYEFAKQPRTGESMKHSCSGQAGSTSNRSIVNVNLIHGHIFLTPSVVTCVPRRLPLVCGATRPSQWHVSLFTTPNPSPSKIHPPNPPLNPPLSSRPILPPTLPRLSTPHDGTAPENNERCPYLQNRRNRRPRTPHRPPRPKPQRGPNPRQE